MNRAPVRAEPLTGGCLCGGVRFEVTLPFRLANHCHCSRCRRHSGTFCLTQGRIARENLRLVKGDDLIRVYRPDNDGAVKAFCSVCGSSLFGGRWPDGSEVSVRSEPWMPILVSDRSTTSSSPRERAGICCQMMVYRGSTRSIP
jgi:hypothetical protein